MRGCRQKVWKPASQPSHSSMLSASSARPHTVQVASSSASSDAAAAAAAA